MSLLDAFLGDRAALSEAEKLLRKQEDRVFQLIEGEDCDLGAHVRADIPRFEALNARQRLAQAVQSRKADGNLLVTALGFALILAKLCGGFEILASMLNLL